MLSKVIIFAAAVLAAAVCAGTAGASQLITRNATNVSLQTNGKQEALITATVGGKVVHVLVWGAKNAIPPTRSRRQVSFKLDYTGGYGKYHRSTYWQNFHGSCLPYDGPPLAWKVSACKAPDGSYWAVQSWQRSLPNYGGARTAAQSKWDVRISHWTGALPVLSIATDWSYRKYDHIFGTYTYGGLGVFGFSSTSVGNPLDSFGRSLYVDTRNSAYGSGWKRDNSFLTHKSKGSFCYGFFPHGSHPAGNGTQYRATAEGPGVAPDAMWQSNAPGLYNKTADATANQRLAALGDANCRPN